ncbi:hypothetical protein [Serratia proteamaculans]
MQLIEDANVKRSTTARCRHSSRI